MSRSLSKLPPLRRRERPFEYQLRDYLWKEMGIRFIKIKPSMRGLPDRMAMGRRNWCLVELKREANELQEHQVLMHDEIYRLTGRSVITVFGGSTVRSAAFLIGNHLEHTRRHG